MKHSSRIIAFGLILCMMAGVLCALAVPRAMANPGDEHEDLYSDELRDYFLDLKPTQETQINQFFDLLDTALDPENNYYVAASMNDGDWIVSIYYGTNSNQKTWYSFTSGSYNGISRQPYVNDTNVNRIAYLYYNGTLSFDFSSANKYTTINQGFWVSPSYAGYCIYPSTYNNNAYYMFSSRDIGSGNGGFTFTANLFAGERPSQIGSFTMVSFQIGDRYFLTIQDQSLFANFDPVTDDGEYFWELKYNNNFPNDNDAVYPVTILWAMIYRLSADLAQYVPNVQNVGYFLYAYEITDLVQSGVYFTIDSGEIWSVYVTEGGGRTDTLLYQSDSVLTFNSPYEPEEPTQQDEAWVNYTNYYNTYNTTHVVPENLGEILYGLNGSMTMPVDVAAPRSFNSGELYPSTVFKYHFSDDENYAFNTNILDVVIFENNEFFNYHLRYWYDDTLNPQYKNVDWYTFQSLCEEFDLIIIISDDYGMLTDNGTSIAYCGSYGEGIMYTDQAIDRTLSNTMSGFAFVTKRAIQKQMLFNFNDGITKTYKLMCDYIDNREKWDDSFLLWSASVFNMLNSIDGRLKKLDDIYNLLFDLNLNSFLSDIASKLDEIANNTAADDSDLQPWYQSLWDFINQFVPTDLDFSTGLDAIEDISEQLPQIPVLSPGPTLPPLPGG